MFCVGCVQLRYPVELRTTPTVLNATRTGCAIAERTLVADDVLAESKRTLRKEELNTTWLKVTKAAEGYDTRFDVVSRDSLTKTQVSREAPEYFQIPEVRCCVCWRARHFGDCLAFVVV